MQYFWDHPPTTVPTRIFLDFDGTLAPLASIPPHAKLPAATKRLLQKLLAVKKLKIFIVSGRALADIKTKVGLAGITYAGNHGMEWETGGRRSAVPVSVNALAVLKTIENEMKKIGHVFPGAFVENKNFSVAFHYRRVKRDQKAALEKILDRRFAKYRRHRHVSLLLSEDVYDFRAETGWTKGEFVRHFAKGNIVYIGDSATDEDVFRRLRDGITIRVGFSAQSAAKYFLKDEKDVRQFLRRLLRHTFS